MSGIVGTATAGERRVDDGLLERLVAVLRARGPDAQGTRVWPSAGLGHSWLRTAGPANRDRQPCSLDGRVWVTADARLDDRDALVRALGDRGRTALGSATDAELLLHAYHAWGDRCPEHLLGDFAFAVWDAPARRLFCARDHFGVKPFFYTQGDDWFAFSNDLDCLRRHPSVDGRLDDRTVVDFLVSGFSHDPARTFFAEIRRLPAAHALVWREGQCRVWPYWTLPTNGYVRFRRAEDYVERFLELFGRAVTDRARGTCVGLLLSGGLDSAAIATIARRLTTGDLRAYTIVYDSLMPDEERKYSGLVADHVDIPTRYVPADGYAPYAWDGMSAPLPEPQNDPLRRLWIDLLALAAGHGRVMLSGEGGDEVLKASWLTTLLGRVPWTELVRDLATALAVGGPRPPVGLRGWARARGGRARTAPRLPAWLIAAPPGGAEADERSTRAGPHASRHPRRPDAYHGLTSPIWPSYLNACDPGVTGVPVEVRFPYLDLRVVEFVLSVPAIPWCVDKMLLRLAMRGRLPEAVRRRPKAPLNADPATRHLRGPGLEWLDQFEPMPQLGAYVARERIPPLAGRENEPHECWTHLRPLSLNLWLRQLMTSTGPERGQP